jgi:hypothetical protein
MPTPKNKTKSSAPHSPSADLAVILSTLPRSGAEDDVTRIVEVYESVERVYRGASLAGTPVIGASSSANLLSHGNLG